MTEEDYERWVIENVEINLDILGGMPVFRGTRLPVQIIGSKARRHSIAQVLEDYSYLTHFQVEMAVEYESRNPLKLINRRKD